MAEINEDITVGTLSILETLLQFESFEYNNRILYDNILIVRFEIMILSVEKGV